MAVIGNAPFQGLVSGGNIIDASIEGVDLSTSAIAARLGYTPVDPGAAAIIGGTINGTTIGATTAASGAFTTVSASGAVTLSGLTASTGLALDASKNLVSVTNTGSGNNVLATSPTLVTPVLGTPTSGNFSTGTFTWPTFNQNTTGTAAGLSATLATASGGTGLTTFTSGGLVYASSTSALTTGSALTFDGTTLTATGTSPIKVAWVSGPSQFTTVNYDGLSVSGAQDAYYIAPSGRTQFWYLGAAEQMRLTNGYLSVSPPSGAAGIGIGSNSGRAQYQYINFGGSVGGTDYAWQIGRNSSTAGVGPADGFYIYDLKATATRLAIDNAGRVLVGTTSPGMGSAKFTVTGNAVVFNPNTDGANTHIFTTGAVDDGTYAISNASSVTRVYLRANGSSYFNGGSLGIGTADPQNRLHVGGADTIVRLSDTNGGTCFWGSDSVGTFWRSFTYDTFRWVRASGLESMRLNGSGNLIIGTTINHTAAPLYVENAINVNYSGEIAMRYNVSGQSTSYWKGMTGTMPGAGGSARGLHFFNYDADSDEGINFWTGRPGSATQLMKLTPAGRLAIGTTDPAGVLDVGANTLASQFYFRNNSSYGSGGGGQTAINVVFGGVNIASIANTGTGQRDGIFKLLDENVVRVSIPANAARGGDTYFNAGGNFAIGTTSALAKLHIEGNTLTLNTENSAQAKILYFRYSNGATIQSDSYLVFGTGGSPSEKVRIDSDGTFRVKGAGTAGSTDAVKFSGSAPASAMIMDSSGRLAIGTTQVNTGLSIWKPNATTGYTIGNMTGTMNVLDYTIPSAIGVGGRIVFGATYFTQGNTMGTGYIGTYKEYAPDNSGSEYNHSLTFGVTSSDYTSGREVGRFNSAGNFGINQTDPQAKLHISRSSSSAFSASDNSWHSVIVNNQASSSTNAAGICFEVSNSAYHPNAGTGIAAVKNGINSDYGSDLVFITRGQSVPSSEKMRILGNGKINIAGVSGFYTSGFALLTDTFYIDVPVENDNPGLANTYHIQASISHANWGGYGCLLDTWYNARANVGFFEQYDTRVVNSGNGGSWTISKPAANVLRITHNAGTYSAGAYYWIRVTMNA